MGSSNFENWLARTGGLEPMNDEERIIEIKEQAERGCSFSADTVLWVYSYFERRLDSEPLV